MISDVITINVFLLFGIFMLGLAAGRPFLEEGDFLSGVVFSHNNFCDAFIVF